MVGAAGCTRSQRARSNPAIYGAGNASNGEHARRCGFSDAVIRRYETGVSDPTGYSLKMLAEQLHISADYLLGITDNPYAHDSLEKKADQTEQTILDVYRREGWSGLARLSVEHLSKQKIEMNLLSDCFAQHISKWTRDRRTHLL